MMFEKNDQRSQSRRDSSGRAVSGEEGREAGFRVVGFDFDSGGGGSARDGQGRTSSCGSTLRLPLMRCCLVLLVVEFIGGLLEVWWCWCWCWCRCWCRCARWDEKLKLCFAGLVDVDLFC